MTKLDYKTFECYRCNKSKPCILKVSDFAFTPIFCPFDGRATIQEGGSAKWEKKDNG